MARPEQYVGVSGGVDWYDQSDIREMAAIYHVDRLGAFVMWGVQATKKTQLLEVSNKYGSGWHPVGDAIYDAAYEDETGVTSPFIHIYPGEGTPEEQMETILATTARTEGFHQGIQLNRLDWHKPEYDGFIEDVRDLVGVNVPIVAQFHERVLDALNPDGVVERLRQLQPDYVLLDLSSGTGQEMDKEYIRSYTDAIYQAQLDIGVVIAGGLSAENLEEVAAPLFKEFPGLSCDAEGRMRKGLKGETQLDLAKVEAYIKKWASIMTDLRF